jgi:hypothetical protein
VELLCLVEARRNSIVISADRNCIKGTYSINGFDRIRAVSYDVPTAQNGIVTGLFCTLDAGFKRFDVRMDVAEDEIAHGV